MLLTDIEWSAIIELFADSAYITAGILQLANENISLWISNASSGRTELECKTGIILQVNWYTQLDDFSSSSAGLYL
ncbi:hypothetical protein RRG08_023826 [Elysia crispata]|uniref:Uncharacterized protein n=1 Tax=Elysia crispata TaxID=231223 RepID=A0AAE1DMX3_9GAST|nr:hypothetical protein RRG08_023826 [Elysia crispata]